MEFEEYLQSKNIDSVRFQQNEPGMYEEWKKEFQQVHPESFTMQKKFRINPIRRKYQLPHQ